MEVLRRGLREVGERIVAQEGPMAVLFRLVRNAEEVRTSPWMSLEDHEQRIAGCSAARRGELGGPRLAHPRGRGAACWPPSASGCTTSPSSAAPTRSAHLDEVLAHR